MLLNALDFFTKFILHTQNPDHFYITLNYQKWLLLFKYVNMSLKKLISLDTVADVVNIVSSAPYKMSHYSTCLYNYVNSLGKHH